MALTVKEIAVVCNKRYGLNAAESMENASFDHKLFGPFKDEDALNRWFDEMEGDNEGHCR